jgi:hypothetical protein
VYDFHVEALHSFLAAPDDALPPLPSAEWLATLHSLSQDVPAPPSYARNQLAARILSIPLPNNGIRIGPIELFQFICRHSSRYGLRTLDVRSHFHPQRGYLFALPVCTGLGRHTADLGLAVTQARGIVPAFYFTAPTPASQLHEVYSVVAFVLPDTLQASSSSSSSSSASSSTASSSNRMSALGISTATSATTTASSVTSTPGAANTGGASFVPQPSLLSGLPSGREGSLVGKLLPGGREGSFLGGGTSSRQPTLVQQQEGVSAAATYTPRVMRIKMFILRTTPSHTVPLASPRAPSAVGELDLDIDIAGAMGEVGEAAARRLREVVDTAAMHRRRDDLWLKLSKLPSYPGAVLRAMV